LAILAQGFKSRGKLTDSTVVATVMSNLGFLIAMKNADINVVKTSVGDRYVLENMLENNYSLGGEQSGHIIMREFAGTGDGLLTALQLIAQMAHTKKSLNELAKIMTRFPQVLINVSGVVKEKLDSSTVISAAVAKFEAELGDAGRILLRASGTEPLVRVMVEAQSDSIAKEIAEKLAKVVKEELR
jgi:phosphoglucosamine mutase